MLASPVPGITGCEFEVLFLANGVCNQTCSARATTVSRFPQLRWLLPAYSCTLSLASGAGGLGIGMYRRCERPLETTPKGLLQGPAAGAGAFTRPQGSPAQGRAEAGGLLLPDQLTRAALQLGPSRLRSPAAGRRTSQGAQAQIGHALCAGPFLGHLPVHAKGAC